MWDIYFCFGSIYLQTKSVISFDSLENIINSLNFYIIIVHFAQIEIEAVPIELKLIYLHLGIGNIFYKLNLLSLQIF